MYRNKQGGTDVLFEYTNVPKALFTSHHPGVCCTAIMLSQTVVLQVFQQCRMSFLAYFPKMKMRLIRSPTFLSVFPPNNFEPICRFRWNFVWGYAIERDRDAV